MNRIKWVRRGLAKGMGHHFEDNLECKYCHTHWSSQRENPVKCKFAKPTPTKTPKEPHVPQTKLPHDPHEPESETLPQYHSPPMPDNELARE